MSMLSDDPIIVQRLVDVHALLSKHGPHHFDMANWVTPELVPDTWVTNYRSEFKWIAAQDPDELMAGCGTTACLAGWATLASGIGFNDSVDIADWLGMDVGYVDRGRCNRADWFFVGRWPSFAFDTLRNKIVRRLDCGEITVQPDDDEDFAGRGELEWEVVVDMLSDLIAGRRANWWDAGEQDAQSA